MALKFIEDKDFFDNNWVKLMAKVKSGRDTVPASNIKFYKRGSPGNVVIKESRFYLGKLP